LSSIASVNPHNQIREDDHACTGLMQAKAKPGQVKEFVKALVERGLPILKQQPGFIDALALTCRWRITEITQLSGFGISLDNASAIDNN
jgi:hypothetical protein